VSDLNLGSAIDRAITHIAGREAPELARTAVEAAAPLIAAPLLDLITRLADELDDISPHVCWQGERAYPSCDNGGCVARRALIAEARAAVTG
jgi:hypothetical protein